MYWQVAHVKHMECECKYHVESMMVALDSIETEWKILNKSNTSIAKFNSPLCIGFMAAGREETMIIAIYKASHS